MWAQSYIQSWDRPYTLYRVPTSTMILGQTDFFSNVGSSLHIDMSVYKNVGRSEASPLPICDHIPTKLFDTTSLCRDYLHEVVLIQGRAHLFCIPTMKICGLDLATTLHQPCQSEHAVIYCTGAKHISTTSHTEIGSIVYFDSCNLNFILAQNTQEISHSIYINLQNLVPVHQYSLFDFIQIKIDL